MRREECQFYNLEYKINILPFYTIVATKEMQVDARIIKLMHQTNNADEPTKTQVLIHSCILVSTKPQITRISL